MSHWKIVKIRFWKITLAAMWTMHERVKRPVMRLLYSKQNMVAYSGIGTYFYIWSFIGKSHPFIYVSSVVFFKLQLYE